MSKKYKTSEILRESLKYLWDGVDKEGEVNTRWVCFAVEATSMDIKRSVRNEIENRIGGDRSIVDWLYDEHNIYYYQYSSEVLQDYRKRWVLSMITEFEAKND